MMDTSFVFASVKEMKLGKSIFSDGTCLRDIII